MQRHSPTVQFRAVTISLEIDSIQAITRVDGAKRRKKSSLSLSNPREENGKKLLKSLEGLQLMLEISTSPWEKRMLAPEKLDSGPWMRCSGYLELLRSRAERNCWQRKLIRIGSKKKSKEIRGRKNRDSKREIILCQSSSR